MDYRNRLPAEYRSAARPLDADRTHLIEGTTLLAEAHTRDAVAALLHMLTRLANCGLDAGAPPLLRAGTEV